MSMKSYLRRSWKYVKHQSIVGIQMDRSWKREMPMFSFDSPDMLQQWTVGCGNPFKSNLINDADIGGFSESYWGLTPQNTALFWGNINTDIPPESNLKLSGYAAIKSNERPLTLFHHPRFDVTPFRYLEIKAKGDHKQWFINIQTDSLFPQHLWQHRFKFKTPGHWETIRVPFRDFSLTSFGKLNVKQLPMERHLIKTVGLSVLRQPGEFSIELESIKAMNTVYTFGDLDIRPEKRVSGGIVSFIKSFQVMPDNEADKKWF